MLTKPWAIVLDTAGRTIYRREKHIDTKIKHEKQSNLTLWNIIIEILKDQRENHSQREGYSKVQYSVLKTNTNKTVTNGNYSLIEWGQFKTLTCDSYKSRKNESWTKWYWNALKTALASWAPSINIIIIIIIIIITIIIIIKCLPITTTLFSEPFCMGLESL